MISSKVAHLNVSTYSLSMKSIFRFKRLKKLVCVLLFLSVVCFASSKNQDANSSIPAFSRKFEVGKGTKSNNLFQGEQNPFLKSNTDDSNYRPSTQKITFENSGVFAGGVFVGDSITLKLNYFVIKTKKQNGNFLKDCKFLTVGSSGAINSKNEKMFPVVDNKKMPVWEAIKCLKAQKVFIMWGINDISYGEEKAISAYERVIDNILSAPYKVKIYVTSVTPIAKGREKSDLTNTRVINYNKRLREDFCKRKNLEFVDLFKHVNENNYLKPEFCSDPSGMGIHFTDQACRLWLNLMHNVLSKSA